MMVFKLKAHVAGLLALVCTTTFFPTAAGQLPPLEKKGAEKLAGQKNGTDKDRLQGKWQIMSIAVEDQIIKREDQRSEWKGTFEKELFVDGDRFGQVGYSNVRLKLDETRDPKQITVQDDEGKQTYRGIYTLTGDTLKVCMNGDGSDVRRPEEFVTKKGTPLLLIVLKKSPAKKK